MNTPQILQILGFAYFVLWFFGIFGLMILHDYDIDKDSSLYIGRRHGEKGYFALARASLILPGAGFLTLFALAALLFYGIHDFEEWLFTEG